MAKVAKSSRIPSPMDSVEAQVREYNYLRTEIDDLSKRQKEIREDLMVLIENTGFADDDGHWWVELDSDIDGIVALQRQRRVKRSLDMETAEEILKERGLWEDCTEVVRVVDEDKVMQALFDESLSEDDVDRIYPMQVNWALVLKK